MKRLHVMDQLAIAKKRAAEELKQCDTRLLHEAMTTWCWRQTREPPGLIYELIIPADPPDEPTFLVRVTVDGFTGEHAAQVWLPRRPKVSDDS